MEVIWNQIKMNWCYNSIKWASNAHKAEDPDSQATFVAMCSLLVNHAKIKR